MDKAIGFSVYNEFEGDKVIRTGVLNMPRINEKMQGGNAAVCVGRDDNTKRF